MDTSIYTEFEKRFAGKQIQRNSSREKEFISFITENGLDFGVKESLWRLRKGFVYGMPRCEHCGCETKFSHIDQPVRRFCSTRCSAQNRDPGTRKGFVTEEGRNKARETTLRKYGVEHHLQDPDMLESQQAKRYKTYTIESPNGTQYRVQGYERYIVPALFEMYGEEDVVVGKGAVPEVWYEYGGSKRRYFADAYVKSINTLFEIKSTYTFGDPKLPEKIAASIRSGYEIDTLVYLPKEEEVLLVNSSRDI